MVTKEARWILANTNIDPKLVADVWGIDERECWEYLEDLTIALREEEKAYDPEAVQREVREFVNEIPDRKNIRIEAIKAQLQDAKTRPDEYDVARLLAEVAILKGTSDRVTPEMITRAKAYPIARLLNQQRKGNVSCPLHKDQKPSLQIKANNTFSCYSCGEYGDVIHLYRLIHTVDFQTAVKALQ